MIKKTFILMLVISCHFFASGQIRMVHVNVPALAFTNLSISFEKEINEKTSFNLGITYKVPYRIFALNFNKSASFAGSVSRFSITPEYRYYPSGFENGKFFTGISFRYQVFKSGFYANGTDFSSGLTVEQYNYYKIPGFGGGVILGYRFKFQKFLLDFFIVPGITHFQYLNRIFSMPNYDVGTEELDPGEVLNINYPFIGNIKYDITKDYLQISMPLTIPTLRLGLTAGFSF